MRKLTGFRDSNYSIVFVARLYGVQYSALSFFLFLWKGLRLPRKAAAEVGQHCAAAAAARHLRGQLVGGRVDDSYVSRVLWWNTPCAMRYVALSRVSTLYFLRILFVTCTASVGLVPAEDAELPERWERKR